MGSALPPKVRRESVAKLLPLRRQHTRFRCKSLGERQPWAWGGYGIAREAGRPVTNARWQHLYCKMRGAQLSKLLHLFNGGSVPGHDVFPYVLAASVVPPVLGTLPWSGTGSTGLVKRSDPFALTAKSGRPFPLLTACLDTIHPLYPLSGCSQWLLKLLCRASINLVAHIEHHVGFFGVLGYHPQITQQG